MLGSDFPIIFLAGFKFVGLAFFYSLILLWLFLQGLVWLAERYSNLVSGTQWWRSGLMAYVAMIIMVITWTFPQFFSRAESENLIAAMTCAMIFGGASAWYLCGKLYHFEFVHRLIVSVGVPIFVLCSLALGQIFRL